jgi:hypothetical protein
VVVEVLVRWLEVRPAGAEVGAVDEPLPDEQVERPVDGRGVDARQRLADAVDHVVRAQVRVGLGDERVPDQAALLRQPPAAAAEERARRGASCECPVSDTCQTQMPGLVASGLQ